MKPQLRYILHSRRRALTDKSKVTEDHYYTDSPSIDMDGPSELGHEHGPSTPAARRVLKKIDRVIVPLLFVGYMLNFSDKVVLSSAAVFGLRDDNVSSYHPQTAKAH